MTFSRLSGMVGKSIKLIFNGEMPHELNSATLKSKGNAGALSFCSPFA